MEMQTGIEIPNIDERVRKAAIGLLLGLILGPVSVIIYASVYVTAYEILITIPAEGLGLAVARTVVFISVIVYAWSLVTMQIGLVVGVVTSFIDMFSFLD